MSKVITGTVRGSYVNVFRPRTNDLSGKEEYSMMLLIPKQDKTTVKKLTDAIADAQGKKWPKKVPANVRNPLRDGDSEDDLPESASVGDAPYAGNYFVNVKSNSKPGIVDKSMNEVIDESEFMSGDYARVSLGSYAYDQKGNRGVSFGLNNIQVLAKGEPLGGATRPENDFDAVEAGNDEDYSFLDIPA